MQEKEFVALVERLETYERKHPGTYRFRVGLLAALGYLFLFGIMTFALLMVVGVIFFGRINYVVIKVLIIPLGIAAVVLRSLWIEFPEPEGHELKYNDAPRLFELVGQVRNATKGPPVHKVLLTQDYNAGIIQRPRLGMFGWHQNYLQVGLPLLQALSPTDIRAIMAHEFGHLSGSHGKFSSWIYRVRQTWIQVLQNMENNRRYGSGIFERFFNWYAPYFAAYSFVLARAQEYEADHCAVKMTGQKSAARALINLEIKGKSLSEEFWPSFYRRADKQAQPPRDSFEEMLKTLRQPVPPEKAQMWFSQSLTTRHRYDDTHPALADRLASIGYKDVRKTADINLFASNGDQPESDQYFLARVPESFIQQQNRLWQERLADGWKERHKFVAEAEKALVALNLKAEVEELTVQERWERARFTIGTQGHAAAVPLLNDVLALMPDHAAANFTLGEALLEQGDEAGVKHVERAMEKDVHATPAGCELIYFFLNTRGRVEEAEKYRRCIINYNDELELGRRERENISKKDDFMAHGLDREALDALRAQLVNVTNLASAHLVRKVCKHLPDEPGYVLGIRTKRTWYRGQSNSRDQLVIQHLAANVSYPGYTFIIALEHNYKPLRKIFKRIDGSEIYRA